MLDAGRLSARGQSSTSKEDLITMMTTEKKKVKQSKMTAVADQPILSDWVVFPQNNGDRYEGEYI